MCLLDTFTDLIMNDQNTLPDTAGYMASLQAHSMRELHLYCVLLHFSILPLFVAVNYPSIVQPVCYVAVHSVFLCVRSTSQSTVLLSLLLCSSNATVWIIPTPCGKRFVLLWHSPQLSILYSEMFFSRLHDLLLWDNFSSIIEAGLRIAASHGVTSAFVWRCTPVAIHPNDHCLSPPRFCVKAVPGLLYSSALRIIRIMY